MNKIDQATIDQLTSYVERLEKLENEKTEIASFIKDVFAEIKSNGYDTKAIKEILKLRKLEPQDRDKQEYMLDVYKKALGMAFNDGEAA